MSEEQEKIEPVPNQVRTDTPETGTRYFLVVGVLLVLVVALLAALWVRERSARIAAESREAQLLQRCQSTEAVLTDLIRRGAIAPDSRPAQGVTEGGRQ